VTSGHATTVVLTGFTAPFDKNGVLYYLGTNGGLEAYQNPHLIGAVTASMSSIYKGSVHNVVEQKRSIMPNYSNNTKRSWVAVDLGKGRRLVPTRYCIRHGASGRGNAIRNWELRAREKDTDGWTVLRAHYNDDAIRYAPLSPTRPVQARYNTAPSLTPIPPLPRHVSCNYWCRVRQRAAVLGGGVEASSAQDGGTGRARPFFTLFSFLSHLSLSPLSLLSLCVQRTWADGLGFRYFLILQLGPNSSGNDCFFIGGMELYGTLTMDPTLDVR
jgi:hypothetical protein